MDGDESSDEHVAPEHVGPERVFRGRRRQRRAAQLIGTMTDEDGCEEAHDHKEHEHRGASDDLCESTFRTTSFCHNRNSGCPRDGSH